MISILRALLAFIIAAVVHCAWADEARSTEAPPQVELRKLALVIGNAAYRNARPLENSANDATDVCAALRQLNFEVICKLNLATKREFKDAIFEFTGRTNDQTLALFYFAGHGLQIDGLNYLVPTDAALRTKSDIEDESVQINYLMSELESRHAALNIFLFDACRDNPFVSPIRGYAPRLGMASQLYTPSNTILAMSTGPGQLSLDGIGRNGTFTKNLLKHINTPRITVEDMLKSVSGGTSEEARRYGRQQLPQITTSYTDRYCMAGCVETPLVTGDPQVASKTQELKALQEMIVQTKAKQAELDEQKTALLKKQTEIDQIKLGVERTQQQRSAEAKAIDADIDQARSKALELEAIKTTLLKKQEELNQMRDALNAQQASIEMKNKEIQTRKIEAPPDPKSKRPIIIIPSF